MHLLVSMYRITCSYDSLKLKSWCKDDIPRLLLQVSERSFAAHSYGLPDDLDSNF